MQGYANGIEADLRAARTAPPGSRLAMAVQVRSLNTRVPKMLGLGMLCPGLRGS